LETAICVQTGLEKKSIGKSADAAGNTENLINDTLKKIDTGFQLTRETSEMFTRVSSISKTISDLIGNIAKNSEVQSDRIERISIAITEMDRLTHHNAEISRKLRSLMGYFQTSDNS